MPIWNLKELRDQIRSINGDKTDVMALVDAVADGIDVFRYHLATARDSLESFVRNEDATDPSHLEYLLGAAENKMSLSGQS